MLFTHSRFLFDFSSHNNTSAHFLRSLMTSYLAQVAAASMASPSALLPQPQQHLHLQQQQQQKQQKPQATSKSAENSLQLQHVGDDSNLEPKYENAPSSHEAVSRRPSANPPDKGTSPEDQMNSHLSPVQQLQRGYEAHLESLRKSTSTDPKFVHQKIPKSQTFMKKNQILNSSTNEEEATKTQGERTEDDEGTILLLDFMKSAQRACGDPPLTRDDKKDGDKSLSNIIRGKGHIDLTTSISGVSNGLDIQATENSSDEKKFRMQPVAVTDTSTSSRSETSSRTSSQPTESSSSIEDSDSKSDKTDPSSGEESEKESAGDMRYRGPPRKRLKTNSSVREFTAQNLAEHSRMMDKRNSVEDKDADN